MLERSSTSIKLSKFSSLPTIEVDLDSFPDEHTEYDVILARALGEYAAKHTKTRASIYVYHGDSVNFGKYTWSAFFGVSGPEALLTIIEHAFKAIRAANVKVSNYIKQSQGRCEFHIEDGRVWQPEDPDTWYSLDPVELNVDELTSGPAVGENVLDIIENTGLPESAHRQESPSRYRNARSDASIASIQKTIEEIFGLPSGSVLLCGPNKKPLRSDAKIATLRNRWLK